MKSSSTPSAPRTAVGTDGRRRLSRAERRDQLLSVAAELVKEGGLAAVTMEGVADRAGVSKALPYSHFANADDLLVELYRREVVDHRRRVREDGLRNPSNPSRAAFREFFHTIQGRHVVYSVLTQPTQTPGPLRDQQLAFQRQSEQFFASRYREKLDVAESTALIAACIMLQSLGGTIRAWSRGYGSEEEIEEVFVTMIDEGLRALRRQAQKQAVAANEAQTHRAVGDTVRATRTPARERKTRRSRGAST